MSKKLTKSEQEFLVKVISKKIAEKRNKQVQTVVSENQEYIDLSNRAEQIESLLTQLNEDFKVLNKKLCTELGMSGGYGENPISLNGNSYVELKICGVSNYLLHDKVEEKLMYEQVVLGGISEDFINRVVEELS
jgi:hypothetical protein